MNELFNFWSVGELMKEANCGVDEIESAMERLKIAPDIAMNGIPMFCRPKFEALRIDISRARMQAQVQVPPTIQASGIDSTMTKKDLAN